MARGGEWRVGQQDRAKQGNMVKTNGSWERKRDRRETEGLGSRPEPDKLRVFQSREVETTTDDTKIGSRGDLGWEEG